MNEDFDAPITSNDQGWKDASPDQPCPACGRTRWCSISADGKVAHCREMVEQPHDQRWALVATKTDTTGNSYQRWELMGAGAAENKAQTSAINLRHEIYQAYLDHLDLVGDPLDDLHRRGLSDEQIKRRGYRYLGRAGRKNAIQALMDTGYEPHLGKVPGFYWKDKNQCVFSAPSGILIPVRNVHGQIEAIKIRTNKPKGNHKYLYASSKKHGGLSPGSPVHVPLCDDIFDLDCVRVTEGELKADIATALSGMLTLGLPGVGNFRNSLDVLKALGASTVVISFDADFRTNRAVAKALRDAVPFFRQHFPKVEIETWPATCGKAIDDVLAAGKKPKRGGDDKIAKMLAYIEEHHGPYDELVERRKIVVTTEEHEVNNQAITALANDKTVYQRGGYLVHILGDAKCPQGIRRPPGSPRIAMLAPATLRERLTKVADWFARDKDGEAVPAHPPQWAVGAVGARGHWSTIRTLEGIVTGPVLRADGSVLAESGYDESTGLLCQLATKLPFIRTNPTPKDISQAINDLMEVVVDFPFEKDFHRSGWISFLLTILARFAIEGPVPGFLFDANTQGTGKGLLCDGAAMIATGRTAPRMTNAENEDEARKLITSLAMAGDPLVMIDNISGTFGGPVLEAAFTADVWKDRLLGTNDVIELPLKMVWSATGNNVALTRDMTRRIDHVRLSSNMERPEERQDFRHPKLLQWVRNERGRLLGAAMTILRGFYAAGQPAQGLKPWGSFESWSDIVRSAVVWAGLPDPGDARQELANRSDNENQAIRALLGGLQLFDPNKAGLTSSELLAIITNEKTRDKEGAQLIREALGELCPTKGGLPTTNAIGAKFRNIQRRVVGGCCLTKRDRNNTSAWFVEGDLVGITGHTGDTGHIPTPSSIQGKSFSRTDSVETEQGENISRKPRKSRGASDDVEVI